MLDPLWITTGAGLIGTLSFGCVAGALKADLVLTKYDLSRAQADADRLLQINDALDAENQEWARRHTERLRPLRAYNAARRAAARGSKAA